MALPDPTHELGSRTVIVLGGMIAHADAHFSEIHSCLDMLFYYVNEAYSLEPIHILHFWQGEWGDCV